jgi:predicted P-loop ATPase
MMVGKRTVNDAMAVVAQEHRFHAVRNFLDGLEWDGEERIEYWTTTHLGAEPATTTHAFGRRFLISAVSRIYQPGSKADTVLVLEGEEGTLRSTAFSVLAGDKWFTDQLPDIRSEDADLLLLGKWFVEIADMDTFKGIRSPAVAQFLTRRVDRYRPSSGRVVDVPRGIVFVATANCADDLYDETGGLTFWPVAVGDIDIPKLRADRDQLWAEAVVRYKAGEPWCMDNEEQTRPHYDSAEIGGPFSRSYVPARDKRTLPTTFLRRAGLPCRA